MQNSKKKFVITSLIKNKGVMYLHGAWVYIGELYIIIVTQNTKEVTVSVTF